MNTKEKAQDLVDKFVNQMRTEGLITTPSKKDLILAKNNALITIEEVLKVIPENLYNKGSIINLKNPTYEFYEKVKLELQSLNYNE